MALKKNNHQISFLHVYHHTSIFFIWWVITYYAPGGESKSLFWLFVLFVSLLNVDC